jgi:hypothetical protein
MGIQGDIPTSAEGTRSEAKQPVGSSPPHAAAVGVEKQFVYFRLYAPYAPVFSQSWRPPDSKEGLNLRSSRR